MRQKKLLLHKSQIRHLAQEVGKMGYSLIPLQVYLKDGRFKMELGLCKGKKLHDKRDDMRPETLSATFSAHCVQKTAATTDFFHSFYGGVLVSTGLWAVR